jgi:Domain of unknown function (DUF3291)
LVSFLPRRSYWSVFSFIKQSGMVQNQLKGSKGLVGYSMKAQILGKKAWTLSVWEDETALQDFVHRAPHADIMRKPILQPGKSKFVRFSLAGSSVPPNWDEALERLKKGS